MIDGCWLCFSPIAPGEQHCLFWRTKHRKQNLLGFGVLNYSGTRKELLLPLLSQGERTAQSAQQSLCYGWRKDSYLQIKWKGPLPGAVCQSKLSPVW